MATIHFYGKENCINNKKQKDVLRLAGHEIIEHDILTTPWTVNTLRAFFTGVAFENWFNPSAPRIKSSEVIPSLLTEDAALAAMIKDPYLIKRPLMLIEGISLVGFDETVVEKVCASSTDNASIKQILKDDLTRCPLAQKETSCDTIEEGKQS